MKEAYIAGVFVCLFLIIIFLIRHKVWRDFEECTSVNEIIGMATAIFIGFFIYSLFSWIAVADTIYTEILKRR